MKTGYENVRIGAIAIDIGDVVGIGIRNRGEHSVEAELLRKMDTDKSAGEPIGFHVAVVQDGNTLTVSTLGSRDNPPRGVLNLDGTESSDGTAVITAQWQGNQLVMSIQVPDSIPDGPQTIKQTWSMEGELLMIDEVIVSRTTGAMLSGPDKTTYRKS